jgi:hypothetical protein
MSFLNEQAPMDYINSHDQRIKAANGFFKTVSLNYFVFIRWPPTAVGFHPLVS